MPAGNCLLAGLLTLLFGAKVTAQSDWPQFRGPNANPIAENPDLPDRWSKTENVEWSAAVPGRGWSSPVVTNGRVFLTTVVTDGRSKPPQTGTDYSNEYVAELTKQGLSPAEVSKRVQERDIEKPEEVLVHYWLYCLDLKSGKVVWKDKFHAGRPPGGRHRKNSFASETPVTDGQRVYVYIANLGLFAYDLEGRRVWDRKLQPHPIYLNFGTGSSPVLHKGRLILVHDNEENSFIAAFNAADGTEVWRTERTVARPSSPRGASPKSGWVTPFLWQNKLRTEIVTMSPGTAISYDTGGKELWRLSGVTVAPAASSFAYQGALILDGGKRAPMLSMQPGANGELRLGTSDDKEPSEEITWSVRRAGTYIPTPVAYQGGVYVFDDKGIVTRLDAKSGKQTFKSRLSSRLANVSSSPWAYNGLVFCLSEQGDTYVLKAGEEFKLLHKNSLDDFCMATPAIAGDRLIIRTEKTVYSIRNDSADR